MVSYAETLSRRVREAFDHTGAIEAPTALWMPLAEAAETLQSARRGSDLDRISRGLGESDEALLAFWARCVAEAGVPVYGSRIMASRPEAVPVEAMRKGRLIHQASRLDTGSGQPIQDFCALRVRRDDLQRYLAEARQSMAS